MKGVGAIPWHARTDKFVLMPSWGYEDKDDALLVARYRLNVAMRGAGGQKQARVRSKTLVYLHTPATQSKRLSL